MHPRYPHIIVLYPRYPYLTQLGRRWQEHVGSGRWQLYADPFWTYPHCFHRMRTVEPELYATLAEAQLVIFKGDLNYRKLVGDLNWEATVPFRTALQVCVILNGTVVLTKKESESR